MSKRLLELATVRTELVTIAGETVTVREPSALETIEYRSRLQKKDGMAEAVSYLIGACVVDDKGAPIWTPEEADRVGRGRSEVWTPLVNAITGFMGREKKVPLTPSSDSTTA